jgi:hypothetical protein
MSQATVKIHPDSVAGLSPEIDTMMSRYKPGADGMIEMPAPDALDLRQELNNVAGWKAHPMDAARAQAMDSQAAAAHQNLAQQFSGIDPTMEPLSQELQQAYTTQKQAIGSAGKNPIGTVLQSDAASGLAKKGRLGRFDEGAGSDLSGLGKNIKTANDRLRPLSLSDLFSIHGPEQAATKLASPMTRGYDAAAEAVSPALGAVESDPSKAKAVPALIQMLQQPGGSK